MTLGLYIDANQNGTFDAADLLVATTVTNGAGGYLFSNLPTETRGGDPIEYLVVVTDEQEIVDGYWHSEGVTEADNNSQNDEGYPVTLNGNTGVVNNLTADMGYYTDPAAVGNFVWNDLNNNGLQDGGEPGMSGVAVTLTITYPDGSTIRLVDSTDNNGHYDFNRLLTDESYDGDGTAYGAGGDEPYFELSVASPAGYEPTIVDAVSNSVDWIDSEDPTGTQAYLQKGVTNTDAFADPTNETRIATYDFGFRVVSLPVSLVSFEGKEENCDFLLSWVTEYEENIQFFEIQHSLNGEFFTPIGRITPLGSGSTYRFVDNNQKRQGYYRLMTLDRDGTFSYSDIIFLESRCGNSFGIDALYPNPVGNSDITLQIYAPTNLPEVKLRIVDVLGRIQFEMTQEIPQGASLISLDTQHLSAGTYFVQVEEGERVIAQRKFVKVGE